MAFMAEPGAVPVASNLSMYDPIYIGIDEYGECVYCELMYRNLLVGGEPGGGKSGLLNLICAYAAACLDTRLVLFDGKLVELGQYRDIADEFVGPDMGKALRVLRRLQALLNNRLAWLDGLGRRKIEPGDGLDVVLVVIDEIAYFSATVGNKAERDEFDDLLRDVVSRGRAVGIVVVAATQRPSFDIIPTSLRDLFAYRCAFRCTTTNSSNIVLGQGWAELGYSANDISPLNRGAAYLLAESGMPRRIKCAFLTDDQIRSLVDYAAWIRRAASAPTKSLGLFA